MKNFQLIYSSLDTSPLLVDLKTKSHLWNQNTLRTKTEGTPHSQVDDIWLRMNDLSKCHQAEGVEAQHFDHRAEMERSLLPRHPDGLVAYAGGADVGGADRLLLHAQRMQFRHPYGGTWIDIEAPCPF